MSQVSELFSTRLPLNRKERFYTGTVLPMIVACDDFAHLGRFLRLCGLAEIDVEADPAHTNIEFFTEYGFKESLDDAARQRFSPTSRDTPDVVLFLEGSPAVLLGIEAKVFHRPSLSELDDQLTKQANLLAEMARGVGGQPVVGHVALLPAGLGMPERIGSVRVVTWERVAEEYRDVAPAYWIGVLDEALRRYEELASKGADGGTYRQNNDDLITGSRIVELWRSVDREFTWMGRSGGLHGTKLNEDLASGGWRSQDYEVRHDPLTEKRNWFPIDSFYEAVQRVSGRASL